MSNSKKPVIAICYDFDGTLSPLNMQEYNFFPELDVPPSTFWSESKQEAEKQEADEILSYMKLMVDKANASGRVKITRKSFEQFGTNVKLFEGVVEWFDLINKYGREKGFSIEHYIISSGIKEMIAGSAIASCFKKIYASSFFYDQHEVAKWPATAINYTTKTQYLFRINKGTLDVTDNQGVNDFVPEDDRPVPFSRIIYIGDGLTDIPCMRLVKEKGGNSIAVYKPNKRNLKSKCMKLFSDGRVNYVAAANYSENGPLFSLVSAIIDSLECSVRLRKLMPKPKRSMNAESTSEEAADSTDG